MAEWTAEITNNPDQDYDLYIELLEDDEYRGRIFRAASGGLTLGLYKGNGDVEIPLDWLLKVAQGAERDLVSRLSRPERPDGDPGEPEGG